jgi:hypothetical protein
VRWLIALAVVVGGFIVGGAVSSIFRRALENPKRDERIRNLAGPAASLVFGLIVSLALVAALGVGDPDSLKPLPGNLIAFVPKVIIAALFFIAGSAVSSLVANAVATSVLKATGKPQPQLARLVRSVVTAIFVLLSISQLGINTKIVDLLVTGVIACIALSIALMTGLGSRHVAANVAAGRYLRRLLRAGDVVESEPSDSLGKISGTVVSVHGATVEFSAPDATPPEGRQIIVHVPNALLLQSVLRIQREQPVPSDTKS